MASLNKSVVRSGLKFLRDKHETTKARLEAMRSGKNGENARIDEMLGPIAGRIMDEVIADSVVSVVKTVPRAPSESQTRVQSPAKPVYKEVEVPGKRGRKTPKTSSVSQTSTTVCPNCDTTTKVLEFISHLELCMFNEKQGSQRVMSNLKKKSSSHLGVGGKKNPRRGARKRVEDSSLEAAGEDADQSHVYTPPKKKGKHSKSPK